MNIMVVSMTERTREIGIYIAVGAQPGDDIRLQILIKAVTLSLPCRLIGLLGGIGTWHVVSLMADFKAP